MAEELMKFDPKKRLVILVVSAIVIWVLSFLLFYWLFNAVEYVAGRTTALASLYIDFSALFATLFCLESWLFGVFELIEKYVCKRSLMEHLDGLKGN